MATALGLFARQGFSSVTIKDIARALKVNTALMYYYFDSKEDLFRATLEYCIKNALETFREFRQPHEDPVKMLSAWFSTQARLASQIRQLLKIMLDYRTSSHQSRIADAAIRLFYEQEIRILSTQIRKGIEQGIFERVNVKRAAQVASTHLDGIMVRSLIHKKFDMPAAVRDLEGFFLRYLGYPRGRGKARNHR